MSGKLDKVTTEGPGTNYIRVYTIDNNGNQTITSASSYRGNNCIVIRDANAQINVPDTPGNQYHATSKKYVDEGLDTKLDKVTNKTSTDQVYYKTANGTNKMLDCNTGAVTTQTIMMRDSSGHCKVIDPVNDLDIANKKYVDDTVAASVIDTSNLVTLDTQQTITGAKDFTAHTDFYNSICVHGGDNRNYFVYIGDSYFRLTEKNNGGNSTVYESSLPKKSGTLALTSDIPTDYVSTSGDQTIGGKKTFTGGITAPNFTAQGSNQSTVYGDTQFVHTFADNTKLNLQFPKKKGNQTIATVGDIPNYYTHCITFKSSNNDTCGTTIIRNTSNTAFTVETLKTWLYDNNFINIPNNTTNGIYMASGAMYYNNTNIPIIGLRSDNTKIIGVAQKASNGFQQPTITNVVDIVI